MLRKPQKYSKLNSDIIAAIIHKVNVAKWSYAQVAVKFRVTKQLIGNIMKKNKLDGGFIGDIQAMENSKLAKHDAVVQVVQ